MPSELISAAIVTFGYTGKEGKEEQVKCVVPADWFWSPEGLAHAFAALRAGFFGPEQESNRDTWESFHVVSMQEDFEYLILRPEAI